MIFRRALPEDTSFIAEALKDILILHARGREDIFRSTGAKYDEIAVLEMLSQPNKFIFVAVNNNNICGYAICELLTIENNTVLKDRVVFYLDDLYLLPETRGTGCGKKFMDYLFEYAKSLGCNSFELNVWEFDGSATGFYKKCGMTTQRRIMEKPLK